MDFATLFGILFSMALIGLALGDAGNFVNASGMLIVLGGTFGAMLTNYPLKTVFSTGAVIRKALLSSQPDRAQVAAQILEFSYIARREGILSLEPLVKEIADPYLRKGMQLMVDGLEPQTITAIMENEINNTEERHELGVDMLNSLASYAPALGLIGTVIGLVRMLGSMTDPSTIGPAMAIALLTTFYGAILANLVFLPICGKLKNRSKTEIQVMEMQLAGILGIAKGENPRVIKEMLEGFQPPRERGQVPLPG
ncbi:motility protein A [Desulfovibrio sp. OttesenSCG-928-C06]|nr:motility protein A [Desulfovibrio sp. OttesenSCG-928-C06]